MIRALTSIVLLSCAIGPAAAQSSYYEWNGSSPAPRPPRAEEPEPAKPKKVFIVDGASTPSPAPRTAQQGAQPRLDEQGGPGGHGGDHVALPPNMERGVRDLEAGMEDLRVYTAEMAVHIQRNGLRGFLAVPPEIKQKGNAIGKQIGHGVNGITTDVGKEMVAPERH